MPQRSMAVLTAWLAGLWLVVALSQGGVAWTPAFLLSLAMLWSSYLCDPIGFWDRNAHGTVFFAALAVYLSTFRWRGGDDTPASILPIAILKHGTLALDPVIDPWLTGKWKDFVVEAGGRKLSLFSIVPGVLASPLYLLPILCGASLTDQSLHNLSKVSASLMTAASASVFYLGVKRRCSARWALAVASFYALSCFSLSVASQGLWEHGPAQLGLALGLLGLFDGADWLSGFGFGLAAGARPDTALFATAAGCYLIFHEPRRLPRFLMGAAAPLGLLAAYWLHYTGRLEPPEMQFHAHAFSGVKPEALLGLLLSPTRGLLFFCPAALFGIWGALRLRGAAVWLLASCAASWVLVSSYGYWTAGMTYGPRYLSGAATILLFFCADLEGVMRGKGPRLAVFAAAGAFSILVGALGAYLNWPGSFSYEVQQAQAWWWSLHPAAQLLADAGGLGRLPVPLRAVAAAAALAGTAWLAADLGRRLSR
ncbi:MAG: hypothetical protein HY077_12390 [Elusimicrobia bacterium]|nr:hypothetical protein [Elusimicrobiota bacterium]